MELQHAQSPPIILVKTWLELVHSNDSGAAKKRALDMLMSNFYSLSLAEIYIEQQEEVGLVS